MDRQDHMPTQGRRSASRATKLRRRRQRMNALLLIGAVAAIAWLVFILPVWLGLPSPFTELKRAIRTVGTDSGDVESAAELSNLYEGLRISEVMPSNRSSITGATTAPASSSCSRRSRCCRTDGRSSTATTRTRQT